MNILLLMMAGSGTRFGADIPKQFVEVNGRPVFSYILEGYQQLECIDRILVVTHPDWFDYVTEWREKLAASKMDPPVAGGATRSESVKNGLTAASAFASDQDVVLLHDATHPYVDAEGTEEVIAEVKEVGGATLAQFQYDTVYRMDGESRLLKEVVPRQEIVSGASPEAFRFGKIFGIYENASQEELERMTSAGAIALAYHIPMKVVKTDLINLKITYPRDMELFRALVDSYFPNAGEIE